jgi:hypothetical protein
VPDRHHPARCDAVALTKPVYGNRSSVRVLDRRRRSIGGVMDIVAIALAVLAFVALYGLIELVDRV